MTVSVEELIALRASLLGDLKKQVREKADSPPGVLLRLYAQECDTLWNQMLGVEYVADDHRRRFEELDNLLDRFLSDLTEVFRDVDPEDWRVACEQALESGSYAVVARKSKIAPGSFAYSRDMPVAMLRVACHVGLTPSVAVEVLKRIQHVGPETLLEGVSLDTAISVKEEIRLLTVTIKEGQRASSRDRAPIPERVRKEVWRRDGGRCVDCSSRERLEYDHIIPVSKGGSNTARNIELRCETCNRRKAAQI